MKCVKKAGGKIIRVTDTKAQEYVSTGNWRYVPKSEWKKDRQKEEQK